MKQFFRMGFPVIAEGSNMTPFITACSVNRQKGDKIKQRVKYEVCMGVYVVSHMW